MFLAAARVVLVLILFTFPFLFFLSMETHPGKGEAWAYIILPLPCLSRSWFLVYINQLYRFPFFVERHHAELTGHSKVRRFWKRSEYRSSVLSASWI